jgi:hypothetical protein
MFNLIYDFKTLYNACTVAVLCLFSQETKEFFLFRLLPISLKFRVPIKMLVMFNSKDPMGGVTKTL